MPHINAMPYDAAIHAAAVNTGLASDGTADAAIAAALNVLTVRPPIGAARDITARIVRSALFATGGWRAVYLLSLDAKTGDAAHDNAMAAAQQLVTMADHDEALTTSNPGVQFLLMADFTTMKNWNATITDTHIAAVAASFAPVVPPPVPFWQSIGAMAPLNDADIARAREI